MVVDVVEGVEEAGVEVVAEDTAVVGPDTRRKLDAGSDDVLDETEEEEVEEEEVDEDDVLVVVVVVWEEDVVEEDWVTEVEDWEVVVVDGRPLLKTLMPPRDGSELVVTLICACTSAGCWMMMGRARS